MSMIMLNQIFEQYRQSLLILSASVLTGWLYNKYWINRRLYSNNQSMKGKSVLITGANTGIGYETAKDLLQRGARLIIACRNLDKGYQSIEQLIQECRCDRNKIRLMECDLSSFDSVRHFAQIYNQEEQRLDVLICNAGVGYSSILLTKDNFNFVIQTNYLSHFLLTNLLLNKLKQSKPSRILNVSSDLHKTIKSIHWADAFTQAEKSRLTGAYGPSKLFQILSTYQLKRDLLDNEDINAFALTPGLVSTSIKDPMEESVGLLTSIIYYPLTILMKFLFAKTPQMGAQTTIYCAVEPNLEKSKDLYFQDCAVAKSSSLSMDPSSAEQLWTISCQAVGIEDKMKKETFLPID